MKNENKPTLLAITTKTVVVHTLTYFFIGMIAFSLFNYAVNFADPAIGSFMRQADDPMVQAGVLFQPIRGILFGLVFYLLRDILFKHEHGWLIMWITLVVIGILSTFGPTPGSIEGFIYTKLSLWSSWGGIVEVLSQSLLLSSIAFYWVNHPGKKWLAWILVILFLIALILPTLGLLARFASL